MRTTVRSSRTVVRWPVLAAILLLAAAVTSGAQPLDRAAAFGQLTLKAEAQGSVPVIARLHVPGIDALTAASVAAPLSTANPSQVDVRIAADAALRAAIDDAADAVIADLPRAAHTVNRRYASIPFVALTVTREGLAALQGSPAVIGIEEDIAVPLDPPTPIETNLETRDLPTLNNTVNFTGASTAWGWGFTGAGWYVAILDTGIRSSHQFFAGKTIVEACFARGNDGVAGAGDCPNGQSTDEGPGTARHYASTYSGYDHGTHVAGIAAGSTGSLSGMAKNASIIALQVFSKIGTGVSSWNSDSLAGLDWVYQKRAQYRVAAANMSLGGGQYSSACDSDSRKAAVDNLRNVGIATAIASGNDGWCGSVSAPGCISSAVTVGASTDNDGESDFNNWHASMQKLFAPGSAIYSATGGSDTSYASWNGTSMATPHVAGVWALMKHAIANGTVSEFLKALQETGVGITSVCDSRRTSIGRIRVDRAIASLGRLTLVLQSTQFGTTDPAPGTLGFAVGSTVEITARPDTYAAFINWSGDASGSTNPLQVLMDRNKSITANFQYIYPPSVSATQQVNRSASQAEYINVIRWGSNASNQGLNINRYRVYQQSGSTWTLVFEGTASQSEYQHRRQPQGTARYYVAAVTADNREGQPAFANIQ